MTDYNYLNNTSAPLELLGVPNIFSPTAQFVSASRAAMFSQHLTQSMILDQPEFNKLFTNEENKLIDYTFNRSRREYDCEIVAVIPKYEASILTNGAEDYPRVYVITLTYEPNGVRHLDYFTVDKYFMGKNGFGWTPILENRHRIKKGDILDKDTIITHSAAQQGNRYCMGTNLNVITGSFPETIEDAFIISESAARKLQTTEVKQQVINCRPDRRPLNLNGDASIDRHMPAAEKFLPDIGSTIREDGALCAFRPIHWTTCIADSDPDALREPLPLQDEIIYGVPGAKIVDLTFNVNRSKLNNCYDQALRYMRSNTKCWEGIWDVYSHYKNQYKLTPAMSDLVTMALYRIIAQGGRVPVLENETKRMRKYELAGTNGQQVDFLQAIIHYTAPRKISNGDKLTDLSGAKH